MNKTFAKKFKKASKTVLLTFVTLGVLGGFLSASMHKKYEKFATQEQVEEIAEALECDTSYLFSRLGNNVKLRGNGDEPIYICFDGGFDPDYRDIAEDALEYSFSLLEDINPEYTYDIVDADTYNQKRKEGKTGILFRIGNRGNDSVIAEAGLGHQIMPLLAGQALNEGGTIDVFAKEGVLPEPTKYSYVNILHEICHHLGFADVYTSTKDGIENTIKGRGYDASIMSPSYYSYQLAPNDYACLLSLYTPKIDNKEELDKKILELQEKMNDYRQEYYDTLVARDNFFFLKAEIRDKFVFQKDFDGTLFRMEVYIEDDKYKVKIFKNGQFVSDGNGFCVTTDRGLVLDWVTKTPDGQNITKNYLITNSYKVISLVDLTPNLLDQVGLTIMTEPKDLAPQQKTTPQSEIEIEK